MNNREGSSGGAQREGFRPPKKEDRGFRVNREIYAPKIRVIDDEGGMLGEMTVAEGIRMAQDRGLDLIEVAPNAKPPTCKIMDYGKYKYEQKKKQQQSKKNQIQMKVKEIQLRPTTEQHDLNTKLKHTREFLEDGDKAKINVKFRGREIAYQDMGRTLLERVIESLKDIAVVETPIQTEGKQMFIMLAPDPAKLKDIMRRKREKAAKAAQQKDVQEG